VLFASPGQLVDEPSHCSAGSQTPADARHSVPALPAGWWHVGLAPLQVSVVHTLPSSVHGVLFALNVHDVLQHDASVPLAPPLSHCSGLSMTPSPQSEK
jgi:hypothetical protein